MCNVFDVACANKRYIKINKETNWQSLSERRSFSKLKNFIKVTNGECPDYLRELVPDKVGSIRTSSRASNNFIIPKCRTETFKRSYFPSAIKTYNDLDISDRNLEYATKLSKSKSCDLFNFGNRLENIKHSQMRMKCSKLNCHLFFLHVVESPQCVCGSQIEDNNHFLLECPLFMTQRRILFQSFSLVAQNNLLNVDTLLYGSELLSPKQNLDVFSAVHKYIRESGRL